MADAQPPPALQQQGQAPPQDGAAAAAGDDPYGDEGLPLSQFIALAQHAEAQQGHATGAMMAAAAAEEEELPLSQVLALCEQAEAAHQATQLQLQLHQHQHQPAPHPSAETVTPSSSSYPDMDDVIALCEQAEASHAAQQQQQQAQAQQEALPKPVPQPPIQVAAALPPSSFPDMADLIALCEQAEAAHATQQQPPPPPQQQQQAQDGPPPGGMDASLDDAALLAAMEQVEAEAAHATQQKQRGEDIDEAALLAVCAEIEQEQQHQQAQEPLAAPPPPASQEEVPLEVLLACEQAEARFTQQQQQQQQQQAPPTQPQPPAQPPPPPAVPAQGDDDDDMALMTALAEQAEAEHTAAAAAAVPPPPPQPQQPQPPVPQASEPPPQTPTIEAVVEELLGLPPEISQAYRRKGVARPYPWQHACVRAPGVLDQGRNLLYSAPTSAGKSWVADVLLLRRVLATRRKALLVLPFVAVVREKVDHLRKLLHAYNVRRGKREAIRVREFHGGKGGKGFGRSHIGVCTIEKANSLVNKLIQEGTIGQLTCLVVDEMHMMGDSQRGYLLELLMSKLQFMQRAATLAAAAPPPTTTGAAQQQQPPPPAPQLDLQIVAMSATLPNLEEVARWMDATLFHTTFRPVPLQENYKLGDSLYDTQGRLLRQLSPCAAAGRGPAQDPDRVVTLVEEACLKGDQVLVFCHYRKHCESAALLLADHMRHALLPPTRLAGVSIPLDTLQAKRRELVQKLREASACPLHPSLEHTLPVGVAFHHAGLTEHEKDAIEGAFREGTLAVIVATSTLGTGINLPAARVIFRSLRPGGGRSFEVSSYRQMAGRAGRAGQQACGESILLLKGPGDVQEARRLMTEPLSKLVSSLDPETDGGRALVRAILECVASGALRKRNDVVAFLDCMLVVRQRRSVSAAQFEAFVAHAECALQYLLANRIVEQTTTTAETGQQQPPQQLLAPTKLGRALFQSAFAPDEGLVVFNDLERARHRLVLDGNLHLLYLVTPVFHGLQPDYHRLAQVYERARRSDPVKARIFELVGLDEARLDRWARQPPPYAAGQALPPLLGGDTPVQGQQPKQQQPPLQVLGGEQLAVMRAKRLWAALALQELVAERPLEATAAAFGVDRGGLQALQQAATSYAGMVQAFLLQLDWGLLARALEDAPAVLGGEQGKELLPLLQIPRLELALARALFDAELQSVAAVASEPEERLADIIRKVRPFPSTDSGPNSAGDQLAFYDDAAVRLKEAARGVLAAEDRQRRARLEALHSRMDGLGRGGGGGDEEGGGYDSSSDEDSDAEGVGHGKMGAASAALGVARAVDDGRSGWKENRPPTAPPVYRPPARQQRGNYGQGAGGGGNGAASAAAMHSSPPGSRTADSALARGLAPRPDLPSLSHFETPTPVRHPQLRPEDYPLHLCARTPSQTPTTPKEYLYVAPPPPAPGGAQASSSLLPAKEAYMGSSSVAAPPVGHGGPRDRLRGQEFVPEALAEACTFVSPGQHKAFSRLTARWSKAKCYALSLHFRAPPPMRNRGAAPWALDPQQELLLQQAGDGGDPRVRYELHYRRYLTRTLPAPFLAGKQPVVDHATADLHWRDEGVLLCGVAVSFDGRRAAFCSLPPPFAPRPWEGTPCLGDEEAEAQAQKRQPGEQQGHAPPPMQFSKAQALPDAALRVIFACLGYAHGPATLEVAAEGAGQDGAMQLQQPGPEAVRNPAFLLCRRWNRAGCAWFNERVSLRGWQRVKWLLAQEGAVKVAWDAVSVLAALQERNLLVRGPIEDARVALALLGETKRRSSDGLLRLAAPPCAHPWDALGWQSAGLLQLGAAVEEALTVQHLLEPFRLIEMPLLPVLAEMQFFGMRVDRAWFPAVVLALQERLLLLQDLADAYGGCHLNLNCADAVHHLLYVALHLLPPPQWSKRTTLQGSNSSSSSRTLLGPTQTEWLEGMAGTHPAVPLVLEWRRLGHALKNLQGLRHCTRLQPLLGSHRVRSRIDPCGSATGRVILSEPAMQHVAHELRLRSRPRATIQDEIDQRDPDLPAALFTDDVAAVFAHATGGPPQEQQLLQQAPLPAGLPVAAVRADSYLWARGDQEGGVGGHHVTSQLGVLRCILSATAAQPFLQNLQGLEDALSMPQHFQQQEQGPRQPAAADSSTTLADYWGSRGFQYPVADASRVRQVLVEFPPGIVLTYPADKVFRRLPEIRDPQAAAAAAFDDARCPEAALCPRDAFPAARGHLLLSADYGQIELCVLAHFSEDPALCAALAQSRDVFRGLAVRWKGLPDEAAVSPAQRDEAKQLAYAILYGQSVTATAQRFAVSTAEADRLQSSFLNAYPGVRTFVRRCKEFCRAHGYVETLLGRRRYLPGIHSPEAGERAQAERQAVNSVCQGSAADLIKLAMVNIHHELARGALGGGGEEVAGDSGGLAHVDKACRLVLQVHDELVYEVKEELIQPAVELVRRCMESAVRMRVPLRVKIHVGRTWGQLGEKGSGAGAGGGGAAGEAGMVV